MTPDEQAEILAKMVSSDDVWSRDRGVIATWLAENTDVSDVLEAADNLIKTQGQAGLWTFLASDVNDPRRCVKCHRRIDGMLCVVCQVEPTAL